MVRTLVAALTTTTCIVALAAPAAAQTREFDVPAGSLRIALDAFARQSGRQVIYRGDEVKAANSPGVHGARTAEDALEAILDGTGFAMRQDRSGAFAVVKGSSKTASAATQLGEADAGSAAADSESADITVTGTRIRGTTPASPVLILTRKDIDRSGYSQAGDLIRSLPQNFGGGQNPGIQATNNTNNNNVTSASTVNLRGLGAAATLVLLNGNRMAADGATQAPDISVIPLGAIQRIDIVTDGASALYGSDAVAGVVNFILRKDYDGAEVSARLGDATQGGGFEQTYNALVGKTWASGYALATAEYSHQNSIEADQREFTSTAPPIASLIPETERKSFLASAEQALTDWVSIKIDGIYNRRDGNLVQQLTNAGPSYRVTQNEKLYQIDPGVEFKLPQQWYVSLDGSLAKSVTDTPYISNTGTLGRGNEFRNATKSVQLTSEGKVFDLPSGEVKVAFGAGYRNEWLHQYPYGNIDRNIWSLFGEISVPLVQTSSDRKGLNSLNLSASLRTEHYDTFGYATTPKVGLRYVPLNGLTIRGTWGKSFKAPTLYQLAVPGNTFLYKANTVGGTDGTFLFEYGGNPDLNPEKASSWTIGVDWSPPTTASLKVSATYFNTNYKDRIVNPITNSSESLSDPTYAQFLTRNPTVYQVTDSISRLGTFYNYVPGQFDPSDVIAIAHDQLTNASFQKLRGVDFSLSNLFYTRSGTIDAFVNGTWMHLEQKTNSDAPDVVLSGRIFNPAEYRIKSGMSWSVNRLTVTGILNYISGETDTTVTPNASIASWTTIDLTISYAIPKGSGILSGVEASLSISNLFDQGPPYAAGASLTAEGIYYDSTNVSPVGRFIALTLKKRL